MRPPSTLPTIALVCLLALGACGGDDDDAANATDTSPSESESPDGPPAIFELSACDTIPAEDLDAVGFEPGPSSTLGEAGSSTGNGCWWRGGLGNTRTAMVGFLLSDLEADQFEEVTTDEETEIGGWAARRITGFDDLDSIDAYPACGVRIEVETGVILETEVSVGQTEHYSTDDEPRLAEACAILDELVPTVIAHVPGGESTSPDEDAGDDSDDGTQGASIPADAEITNDLLCGALVNTEIPAPGFDIAQATPEDSTADASCTWESLGGEQPQLDLWYTATAISSPDGTPLETDGRSGAIVKADTPDRCRAELTRAPGTVVIEIFRVDDACSVVEELARLLAPRFER